MLEILKVVFLGIVEGITEWLPISSTGHMILVNQFIKLDVTADFMKMFIVVIQLGAILAVVVLFWHKLWPFHKKAPNRTGIRAYTNQKKITMWGKILVSCLPAVIIGLPLDDWITDHFYNYVTIALMLIIYGVLFIIVENRNRTREAVIRTIPEITWKTALLIGIFQVLAIIPGTSRSGATILGGIFLGATRTVASEYTFFLAVPVMFGASLFKLVKFGFHFTGIEVLYLVIGMAVAFLVSILAIRFLMNYIKKHDFKVFGWYRIALGAVILIYFLTTRAAAL